ncbi:PDR/VanB family oxidoreductase [Streptomyces sp. NEAU-174]|uniref:PDR/VanB family oxidoreductase n=1 Tax=Streptomyces sp. NEAU-174 TaxID=3458254 RepID=UPI0040447BDB
MLSTAVVGLTLVSNTEDEVLPAWQPGAHIDIQCGTEHRRQYSLCGDPSDATSYRVAVLREGGGRGGSLYVHDRIEAGDALHVSAPRNSFTLEPAARYLFIAGGIGVTPLLPMSAAVDRQGKDWTLVYGGRTRSSMAFVEDLARHGDHVRIHPQDEQGLLPLDELLSTPVEGTAIYCCGPSPLLDAVAAMSSHWPAGSLHVEHFSPKPLDAETERGFEVELARSGGSYHVPHDKTILEVLAEAGVEISSSCEVGTCGTCELTILEGTPDHRDSVLTPEERAEGTFIMPCVSRALSERLVLDL